MDRLERVKKEIERLLEQAAVTDYWRGYDKALKKILSFIDSMQEEPVSIWHDASEEPEISIIICRFIY